MLIYICKLLYFIYKYTKFLLYKLSLVSKFVISYNSKMISSFQNLYDTIQIL